MGTQFVAGATTITPVAVEGFASEREPGTLLHPILGRGWPDYTFRPAQYRQGTARLVFLTETAARECETAMLAIDVVQLVTDTLVSGFSFVIPKTGGKFRVVLSERTAAAWVVEFPWQEVPA